MAFGLIIFLLLPFIVAAPDASPGIFVLGSAGVMQWSRPDPDDFDIYMINLEDYGVALKCYTRYLGKTRFREKITMEPGLDQRRAFHPTTEPMAIECMYHDFRGSYGRGIRLLDTRWPDVERCRAKNRGCGYMFQNGSLYKVSPEGSNQLVGSLPVQDCLYILFLQWTCKERPHSHRLAGRPATRWAYIIGNLDEGG